KVRPPADIAGLIAALADAPAGASLLRIGGETPADRQERKLTLLVELAKELSRELEIDRLLDQVVELCFQVMRVDRVAILMADAAGELVPRRFRSRTEGSWQTELPAPAPAHAPPIPRSIVKKVVGERL